MYGGLFVYMYKFFIRASLFLYLLFILIFRPSCQPYVLAVCLYTSETYSCNADEVVQVGIAPVFYRSLLSCTHSTTSVSGTNL